MALSSPKVPIDQDRFRVAVIGCGGVGALRAEQASIHSHTRLLLAVDQSHEPARRVAERFGAAWSTNWGIAVEDERIDAIVVSAPNPARGEIVAAALAADKHVLVELPMAGDPAAALALADAARASRGSLKIGNNLRYHPAIRGAYELAQAGAVGHLVALTAQYDEGDLLHVADLIHWFAGMPVDALAYVRDERVFGLLRFENGCVAEIRASPGRWLPHFSYELYGSDGIVAVRGLGGAYGTECLRTVKRNSSGGCDAAEEAFGGADRSWALEWNEFVDAIHLGTPFLGTADDGLAAARIEQAIYASARDGVRAPVA